MKLKSGGRLPRTTLMNTQNRIGNREQNESARRASLIISNLYNNYKGQVHLNPYTVRIRGQNPITALQKYLCITVGKGKKTC